MRNKDVVIGETYVVKVSGKLAEVRITGESPYGGWNGVNIKTKRDVRIRTGARLRRLAFTSTEASVIRSVTANKWTQSKPYAVGKIGSSKTYWFATLAEAEAKLEAFKKTDPTGLSYGDYYLDGPEPVRAVSKPGHLGDRLWKSGSIL